MKQTDAILHEALAKLYRSVCEVIKMASVPIKVVEGVVVEDDSALVPTERKPTSPDLQHLPAPTRKEQKLTPEQKKTLHTLTQHIDFKDTEDRLLNTYAGNFVGFCFGDDNDVK